MSYALFPIFLWLLAMSPQDKGEYEILRELIQGLTQDESDIEAISKLSKAIPSTSTLRPIALQVVTIQLIRQREYSKALAILEKQDSSKERWPLSLRVAHEEWKLWLLLELRKQEEAESHFKSLTKTLLSKSLEDGNEKKQLARYMGSVVGMLQAAGDDSVVPPSVRKRAEELIAGHESQSLVALFEQQVRKTREWQVELDAVHQTLRNAEASEFAEASELAKTTLQKCKEHLGELRTELKSMKKAEDRLKQEASQIQTQIQSIVNQENTETDGRPREPSPPRHPDRPEVKRKYDRDKKDWVVDQSATNRDRDRYDREMRQYQDRHRDYEKDKATFPERLRAWVNKDAERRANLAAAKQDKLQQRNAKQQEVLGQQQQMQKHREVIDKQEAEVEQASRKWLQTEGIVSHRSRFGENGALGPSCYLLLDLGAEADRLLAVAREIRTP